MVDKTLEELKELRDTLVSVIADKERLIADLLVFYDMDQQAFDELIGVCVENENDAEWEKRMKIEKFSLGQMQRELEDVEIKIHNLEM